MTPTGEVEGWALLGRGRRHSLLGGGSASRRVARVDGVQRRGGAGCWVAPRASAQGGRTQLPGTHGGQTGRQQNRPLWTRGFTGLISRT